MQIFFVQAAARADGNPARSERTQRMPAASPDVPTTSEARLGLRPAKSGPKGKVGRTACSRFFFSEPAGKTASPLFPLVHGKLSTATNNLTQKGGGDDRKTHHLVVACNTLTMASQRRRLPALLLLLLAAAAGAIPLPVPDRPERRFSSHEHITAGQAFEGALPHLSSPVVSLPNGLNFTFGELVALYGTKREKEKKKKRKKKKEFKGWIREVRAPRLTRRLVGRRLLRPV